MNSESIPNARSTRVRTGVHSAERQLRMDLYA